MYSKMYLITPMVYDKVKNHLDKSDKMALTNINKPYFTPKIEFHGAPNSSGYNYPPYPPMPPTTMPPPSPFNPTYPTMPPPSPFNPTDPFNPDNPIQETQYPSDESIKQEEDPSEMEWTEYENLPPLPPHTSEMMTQTDILPTESQIETRRSTEHQETQANIPLVIPTSEQASQTDPILKKIVPLISTREQASQTDPMLKKIIPPPSRVNITSSRQTDPLKRKRTTIPKRERRGPPVIPQQVSVELPIQVPSISTDDTSRALVPYTGRDVVSTTGRRQQNRGIPSQTVSILRRRPISINLQSGVRAAIARDLHSQHFGQQINPRQQYATVQNQQPMRAITYQQGPNQPVRQAITHQPEIRTQPEYPVALAEPRTISIPQPESLYTVEYPPDNPPGMRPPNPDVAFALPREIYTPYQRKTKKRKYTTPVQTTTTDMSRNTENIDLPPAKKKTYECDLCHAMLSSQYNLTRHKAREAKRFEGLGRLPDEVIDQQPEFNVWAKFPKKRTSTDAKFVPQQHRKRVPVEKPKAADASTYTQW